MAKKQKGNYIGKSLSEKVIHLLWTFKVNHISYSQAVKNLNVSHASVARHYKTCPPDWNVPLPTEYQHLVPIDKREVASEVTPETMSETTPNTVYSNGLHSNGKNGKHPEKPDIKLERDQPLVSPPSKSGVARANNPSEAAIFTVQPRVFSFSSALVWQVKRITEVEWGWDEYPMDIWLDVFLTVMMRQRGIILGGYTVLTDEQRKLLAQRDQGALKEPA